MVFTFEKFSIQKKVSVVKDFDSFASNKFISCRLVYILDVKVVVRIFMLQTCNGASKVNLLYEKISWNIIEWWCEGEFQ